MAVILAVATLAGLAAWPMALLVLGILLNLVVLVTNGNRMPVVGASREELPVRSRHVLATESHSVLWLADRLEVGRIRASVGDILQWTGALLPGCPVVSSARCHTMRT
jgi:hypothetical protein